MHENSYFVKQFSKKKKERMSSLGDQWLRRCIFTAMGASSIPGQRTKIP